MRRSTATTYKVLRNVIGKLLDSYLTIWLVLIIDGK